MSLAERVIAWRAPSAVIVLLVLVLWESAQPFLPLFAANRSSSRDRMIHGARNVGVGVFNGILTRFGFLILWMSTMEWSVAHHVGVLTWVTGAPWVHWALAILLLDAWTYAWHRINHTVPLLWRFHRMHHSDRQMDVTTANRFHVGEIVLSSLARIPLLALLGCRVEELAVYETLLFAVVQFQHANVALPDWLDRAVRLVIVTPHLHKVHHSVVIAEQNTNFSSLFSWWDRLARTWRVSPDLDAIRFGVD